MNNMEEHKYTILDKLIDNAKYKTNQEAFVFVSPDGERFPITWNALYLNSCRAAAGFVDLGVQRGEYVYIMVRNCPEALYTIFGTMIAGAVPYMGKISSRDGSVLKYSITKLGSCSLMIIDPAQIDDVWVSIKTFIGRISDDGRVSNCNLPYVRYALCYEDGQNKNTINVRSIQQLIQNYSNIDHFPIQKGEVFVVLKTSGSTGLPKLVRKSCSGSRYGLTPHNSNSKPIKIFNDNSFTWSSGVPMSTVIEGSTRIMLKGSYNSEEYMTIVIKTIIQERCQYLECLGYMVTELALHQHKISELRHWPLKVIIFTGQPGSPQVGNVIGRVTNILTVTYGLTEAGFVSEYIGTDPNRFENYCVGYVQPGVQVKIVDDLELELPTNTKGEILLKSRDMLIEYVNDKQSTEKVFTADGWYHTGDLGLVTDENKLFVFGSTRNTITLRDSVRVYPHEVETRLMSIDGVKQAIIVPVTRENDYPKLCACIILENNKDITEATIRTKYNDLLVTSKDSQNTSPVEIDLFLFYKSFPLVGNCKSDRNALTKLANEQYALLQKQ